MLPTPMISGASRVLRRASALALVVAASAVAAGAATAAPVPAVVATYNIYQGTELRHVLAATPTTLADAVGTDYANVVATNFGERAVALANQIALAHAEVVGLQEVATWSVNGTVTYDFLRILLDALAARGLRYASVAVHVNFAAQAPGNLASGPAMVTFVEKTAIIARADLPPSVLTVSNPQAHDFKAFTKIPFLGGFFPLGGSWVSADVTTFGRSFRFVTTHLDPISQLVRDAQMKEILDGAAGGPPLIVSGDLNSDAAAPAITQLRGAGYSDSWAATRPDDPGLTCCQVPPDTIVNPVSQLHSRVDYIFTAPGIRPVFDALLGAEPASRTPSGLWPSDHAGLAALVVIGS